MARIRAISRCCFFQPAEGYRTGPITWPAGSAKIRQREFSRPCALWPESGARFVAIACNTAHSPEIIEPLKEKIKDLDLNLELVDMIEETGLFIRQYYGRGVKTGLLATEGTYKSGVYERLAGDIELVIPSRKIRELVHRAIYDRTFGIKAFSNPLTGQAIEDCRSAVRHLADKGAKLVILGCTELPLALPEQSMAGVALLDPAWITARALVSKAAPDKLKEYRPENPPSYYYRESEDSLHFPK